MKERRVVKFVSDIGVAAYLLMHGYTLIGKRGGEICFECNNQSEVEEFESLILQYQPPNEFYTFDSCLMYLKKIGDVNSVDLNLHKCVNDLGTASYLLMNEYRSSKIGAHVVGRRGKYVYFNHNPGCDEDFKRICYEYLTSQFRTYDSHIMALKKIGEYMPS